MEQLLTSQNLTLAEIPPLDIDFPWLEGSSCVEEATYRGTLVRHRGTGSGGYADHVMTIAARELFQESNAQLNFKVLRFVCSIFSSPNNDIFWKHDFLIMPLPYQNLH